MDTATRTAKAAPGPKRWMIWTGRVLSAVPVLVLLASAWFGLTRSPQIVAGMGKFGYSEDKLVIVCILQIGCALLYAFPPTAVLGALFTTAYMGAAVATHVRIGDPGWTMAVIMAVLVWAGLYLRDGRVRELVPLRG